MHKPPIKQQGHEILRKDGVGRLTVRDQMERGTGCGTIGSPRSSSPRLVWPSTEGEISMDGVPLSRGKAAARIVKSIAQFNQY